MIDLNQSPHARRALLLIDFQDDFLNANGRRRASIAGSPGSRWTAALPLGDIPYLPKWATSAFVNPELDPWLRARGVATLALAGLKAGACVSATAKDALARGYEVELLGDAIACDSDASRRRALEALRARGARLVMASTVESAN